MGAEDYLSILSPGDLSAFSNTVQQSDPYGIAGRSLAAWQPDISTWSPATSGITSFAKSFLSGVLGNYARQDAADQLNSVIGVLPQLRADPLNVTAPADVDPDAFAALKGSAILKHYLRQEQDRELDKRFQSDLLMKLLGKKAEVIGESQAYDAMGLGGQDPNSPAYKAQQAVKSEEDAARNELLTGSKYPAIQKLQVTSTALSQLKNIKDIDSASSDIPFATLFIGGLDGSVVREGEYNRVAGANPLLAKFQNQIESALNGKSTLGVNIKKQMYNELVKTQKGLLAEALVQASPRLATALGRGAEAKNVLPFDPKMTFDELPSDGLDPISAIDAALARKGYNPDGTPMKSSTPYYLGGTLK